MQGYSKFQNERQLNYGGGGYPNQGYGGYSQPAPGGYGYPQAGPGGFGGYGGSLERISNMQGVYIKQKFEALEAFTGFESKNQYAVYEADRDGNKIGEHFWRASEKSDFCARQCLAGSCRPFDVKIVDSATNNELLRLHREFTCTCLCLNRPELTVTKLEGANKIIGKIINPFTCCDYCVEVYDEFNKLKYSLRGSCCQLGILCKCPCEPCQIIDFEILDSTGNIISKCQKRSAGFCKACIGDSDQFSLKFPSNATLDDKLLLLSAIFLLDYMYFEDNQQNNNF